MKAPQSHDTAVEQPAGLSGEEEFKLIRSICAGNKEGFRYFVERYQRMVLNLIWRQTRDSTLCRDLAQDVFLKAYSSLPGFRFESSFRTWITRIALNRMSTHFSVESSRARSTLLNDSESEAPALRLVTSPEEHAIRAQHLSRFYRAFTALPDHYRETVLMVAIEGRDYEETARLLGVPLGTVRSRLHQGRRLLKKAMEDA